jgi:hypothetical protein
MDSTTSERGATAPHYSRGCELLAAWLAKQGAGGQAALEERLVGVRSGEPQKRGVLSNILSGKRPMPVKLGVQVYAETGVPVSAWGEPPAAKVGRASHGA